MSLQKAGTFVKVSLPRSDSASWHLIATMHSARQFVAGLLCLLCALDSNAVSFASEDARNAAPSTGPVRTVMKNVMYHFTDAIAVHINYVQGELIPTGPLQTVVFDDRSSFLLNIAYGEIALDCDSLAHALNDHVFTAPDAPIRQLSIQIVGNALIVKGRLHPKGDLPFESTGILSATPDGRIRLHTEKMKAAHLPVKGLMDLMGIEIADLISTRKVKGVTVEKDDLILDPQQIFPPPQIKGLVTAVRIQGNEIVLIFGSRQNSTFAAKLSGNFMAYRDNDLRFGKLTMHDTDMVLIDMDPRDPFDFFLDHYQDQLVAGYSKTIPGFGLRVFMRDYNKLKATPAARKPRE